MDNVTHTLIGASLAATGLRRRSRYAAAAMMIGANIPDVDVIAVPLGHSVEWRRGITHGVAALAVWPFVLTGAILLWHRLRGAGAGRRSPPDDAATERPPVRTSQLLLVSALAVLTHPVFDWMNSYGMRWLMPFDGTWFYGDTLFIVDPWLLATLGVGVWLSRRRRRAGADRPWRPARIAVTVAAAYTAVMMSLNAVAERSVTRTLAPSAAGAPVRLMVAPTPGNPVKWDFVADRGTYYERGVVRIGTRRLERRDSVRVGLDDPRARRAARDPRAAGFLDWSRWPVYRVDDSSGVVQIIDVRYASPDSRGSWASVAVPLAEE